MQADDEIRVRTCEDVHDFLRRATPLMHASPVVHSVVATVADHAAHDPAAAEGAQWYLIDRGGHLAGVAMHTPPHAPHLPLHDPQLVVALARHLADEGRDIHGVGGLREAALTFADLWCDDAGLEAEVVMDQGVHDLPGEPRLPWPVPGALRVAGPDDLPLVQEWMQGFYEEALHDSDRAPDAAPHVRDGRLALWEVDGRPVSMCYASVPCGGVTRIAGVWTPRHERGHGYASAVVAGWSARRQEAGLRCMLYTDLANPTSNGIYHAIGYRRVADSVVLRFVTGTEA